MSKRGFWLVWGGVFKNTDFEQLEPGTEELHGPFHSEAAANRVWQDETRRKVDIATHRLFVMRAEPARG